MYSIHPPPQASAVRARHGLPLAGVAARRRAHPRDAGASQPGRVSSFRKLGRPHLLGPCKVLVCPGLQDLVTHANIRTATRI